MLLAAAEDGGLARGGGDGRAVRRAVRVRARHVDAEGAGARLQAPVRQPRQQEAAPHRGPHLGQLQPPSATVSILTPYTYSISRSPFGCLFSEHSVSTGTRVTTAYCVHTRLTASTVSMATKRKV